MEFIVCTCKIRSVYIDKLLKIANVCLRIEMLCSSVARKFRISLILQSQTLEYRPKQMFHIVTSIHIVIPVPIMQILYTTLM